MSAAGSSVSELMLFAIVVKGLTLEESLVVPVVRNQGDRPGPLVRGNGGYILLAPIQLFSW